jgi:C_GCAxxG_C_C family probable redox protein
MPVTEVIAARAGELVRQGYHCSEAMLLTAGEHLLGSVSPPTIKMASIFGGGLGGSNQEMCGALAGAAMIVGALYGRMRPGYDETKARMVVTRLRERFIEEFGTTQCAPLRARYEKPDTTGYCAPVAERTAMILFQVLAEVLSPTQALPG